MGRKKGVPNKVPGMTPEQRRVRKLAQSRTRRALNPEPIRRKAREYYAKHSAKMKSFSRKHRLSRKYGITQEIYEQLWQVQHGGCAICKKSNYGNRAFHIDHNHVTGKVRGLLCLKCNTRLAVVEDKDFTAAATNYLEAHNG